jgi:hypothetical protein
MKAVIFENQGKANSFLNILNNRISRGTPVKRRGGVFAEFDHNKPISSVIESYNPVTWNNLPAAKRYAVPVDDYVEGQVVTLMQNNAFPPPIDTDLDSRIQLFEELSEDWFETADI